MGWNNAVEAQKFLREEKKLEAFYREHGVSEKDIDMIREMDHKLFNQERSFYSHNISLEQNSDEMQEDGQNPLLVHYRYELSEELGVDEGAEFWWIEQIEDRKLYTAVNSLRYRQKILLQLAVIDGVPEKEIAERMGLTRQAVNARLQTIYRKCRKIREEKK